jgi:predicted short-subunit dehydrogenase-like oxidoreductase (DUF2520 family)
MVEANHDEVSCQLRGRHIATYLGSKRFFLHFPTGIPMQELERLPDTTPVRPHGLDLSVGILGRGRVGTAISAGLRAAGIDASAPLARHDELAFDVALLCVPDAQIATAAERIPPEAIVGHCSGATGLDILAPREAFSLHPLMTITSGDGPEVLAGAAAAVAGTTPRALDLSRRLAQALGMRPFELASEDRAAYHAAASIASNFLITLEAAAERVAAGTGAGRDQLAPLVRSTVENWVRLGPERALTGPVARGDEITVAAQREAVAERAPELLALFDALVEATKALTGRCRPGADSKLAPA